MKTGGLSIGTLAGSVALTGDPELLLTTGALNGAGPVLKLVFLCVCISEVTFFKSAITNISNFSYIRVSLTTINRFLMKVVYETIPNMKQRCF